MAPKGLKMKTGRKATRAPRKPPPRLRRVVVARSPPVHSATNTNGSGKLDNCDDEAAYVAAMLHPFGDAAAGARIPSPYAVRTATRRAVVPFVFTAAADGALEGVFTPHPVYALFSGQSSTFSIGGGVNTTPAVPAGGFQIPTYGVVTLGTMASLCSSFRVVGWGVRFKVDSSMTNTQGRIFLATAPSQGTLPILANAANNYFQDTTVLGFIADTTSTTQGVSAAILSLETGQEFALGEIFEKGSVEAVGQKTSPACMNFQAGNFTASAQATGDVLSVTATTGIGITQSVNWGHTDGHNHIAFRCEGLASGQKLIAEYVVHVEYQPVIYNPTSNALIEDSTDTAVSLTDIVDKIHAATSAMPPIHLSYDPNNPMSSLRDAITKTGRAAGKYVRENALPILGKLAALAL